MLTENRSLILTRNTLFLVWFVAIVILLHIIVPNTDDKSYGFPALNFVANGHMAQSLGRGGYEYIFYNMPGTAFIESGIYWIMVHILHIPINFYTYRIPMALLFVGILFLTSSLLNKTQTYIVTRQVLFLTLLGVSLFAETWINNRPETPIAFFVLLHLFLVYRWIDRPTHLTAIACGLSLGALPAFHPQFISLGLLLLAVDLYIFYKKKLLSKTPLFFAAGLIPSLGVLLYFHQHMPRSWEVLHNQLSFAKQAHPFHKWLHDTFMHQPPLLLLINLIFYVPLFLMLTYTGVRIIYKLRHKDFLPIDAHATALYIGIFITFRMGWGEPYTAGICMLLALLSFVFLLDSTTCDWITRLFNTHKLLTTLACCVVAAFYVELHVTKFTLFPGRYMYPSHMIAKLRHAMQTYNATLVASGAVYNPLFVKEYYAQFKAPDASKKIYWILPSDGQMVELPQDRRQGKAYLSDLLDSSRNFIFLSTPKYLHINQTQQSVRLHSMDSQLYFTAHFQKVLYAHGQHLIVLANSLKLHEIAHAK